MTRIVIMTMMPLFALIAFSSFASISIIGGTLSPVYAQLLQEQQQQQVTAPPSNIFQSDAGRFRVIVPEGWVIDHPLETHWIDENRAITTTLLCLENQAMPIIGGGYTCPEARTEGIGLVTLTRVIGISSMIQFAAGLEQDENYTATIHDVAAFTIQLANNYTDRDLSLLMNSETFVNVKNPHTNQTVAQAPARYIELSVPTSFFGADIARMLVVLDSTRDTAYVMIIETAETGADLTPEELQILIGFELIHY